MLEGQHQPLRTQRDTLIVGRSRLLQRHPVLLPVLLLSGALALYLVSFFAGAIFPILLFLGVPVASVCLLLAFVLGVAGVLAGIISLIEGFDRHRYRAGIFAKPEEQSYANRN